MTIFTARASESADFMGLPVRKEVNKKFLKKNEIDEVKMDEGNWYLDRGSVCLHQGVKDQKDNPETLKICNYVVTNRIFVRFIALRVLLRYFSHDRIGDYVASSSDEVDVCLAEEFLQRV